MRRGVPGLEIKREVLERELSRFSQIALPGELMPSLMHA